MIEKYLENGRYSPTKSEKVRSENKLLLQKPVSLSEININKWNRILNSILLEWNNSKLTVIVKHHTSWNKICPKNDQKFKK